MFVYMCIYIYGVRYKSIFYCDISNNLIKKYLKQKLISLIIIIN